VRPAFRGVERCGDHAEVWTGGPHLVASIALRQGFGVPHFSRSVREVGGARTGYAVRIFIFSTCQSFTCTVPVSPYA